MKKLIVLALILLVTGCKQDVMNQISSKAVEFLDGNYRVTFASGNTAKTWIIKNGKVTSSDKGYYYFWDENKHYVQTPMEYTFVEEF